MNLMSARNLDFPIIMTMLKFSSIVIYLLPKHTEDLWSVLITHVQNT